MSTPNSSATESSFRQRMTRLVDRYAPFDHCRAMLPCFQFTFSRQPLPRLRKLILQLEAGAAGQRPPNSFFAFFFFVPVSLRQIRIAWREHARHTNENFGVGYARQVADLLRLTWRLNHAPHDYYLQKMWLRPDRRTWAQFIQQREHVALVRHFQRTLPIAEFDDKLEFFRRMKAAGIPTIEVLLAAAGGRWLEEFTAGREDGVLRQDLVIKPTNGTMYDGVEIWRRNRESGVYVRGVYAKAKGKPDRWTHDETLELPALLERVLKFSEKRCYVVQGRIDNLPALAPISPHSIANFRIVTARIRGETRVIAALLRMGYDCEKFVAGSYQANIDLETGVLGVATSRQSQWGHGENHVETGHRVTGQRIERWPQLKAIALRGHEQYPWMPTIGWDVIESERGPLLMEANAFWGVDIAQLDCPFLGEVGYGEACLEAFEREQNRAPAPAGSARNSG